MCQSNIPSYFDDPSKNSSSNSNSNNNYPHKDSNSLIVQSLQNNNSDKESKVDSAGTNCKNIAAKSNNSEISEPAHDYSFSDDYLPWKFLLGTGKFSEVNMKFDLKNKDFVALKSMRDKKNNYMLYYEHKILSYIMDHLYENNPNRFFKCYGLFTHIEYDCEDSFCKEQLQKLIENSRNPIDQNQIFLQCFQKEVSKKKLS